MFLDVMGNPPRADAFSAACEQARWMETEWGRIHTIGIKALAELKKTQRLEDYPIISKLALAWFNQPECVRTGDDFVWAMENIFTLPELEACFTEHPEAVEFTTRFNQAVANFGRHLLAAGDVSESAEQPVRELFQKRITDFQLADRNYWRGIIGELKSLRADGKLMPEGSAV